MNKDWYFRNLPIWRMIAGTGICLFGSLWLATVMSDSLAPPAPDWAVKLKFASMVLFFLMLGWGLMLYAGWLEEEKRKKKS